MKLGLECTVPRLQSPCCLSYKNMESQKKWLRISEVVSLRCSLFPVALVCGLIWTYPEFHAVTLGIPLNPHKKPPSHFTSTWLMADLTQETEESCLVRSHPWNSLSLYSLSPSHTRSIRVKSQNIYSFGSRSSLT